MLPFVWLPSGAGSAGSLARGAQTALHASGSDGRSGSRRGWRACLSGETIGHPQMEIETAMNLIWTPAQLAMFAKVVDLNGFSAAARALAGPKGAGRRAVRR